MRSSLWNNTISRVRNIYAASHLPASTSKEGDRGQVIRKHGDKACLTWFTLGFRSESYIAYRNVSSKYEPKGDMRI